MQETIRNLRDSEKIQVMSVVWEMDHMDSWLMIGCLYSMTTCRTWNLEIWWYTWMESRFVKVNFLIPNFIGIMVACTWSIRRLSLQSTEYDHKNESAHVLTWFRLKKNIIWQTNITMKHWPFVEQYVQFKLLIAGHFVVAGTCVL